MVKKNTSNSQNNYISPYKNEVATIFTDVIDFDKHKSTSAS